MLGSELRQERGLAAASVEKNPNETEQNRTEPSQLITMSGDLIPPFSVVTIEIASNFALLLS
jgi:hypothetical protein